MSFSNSLKITFTFLYEGRGEMFITNLFIIKQNLFNWNLDDTHWFPHSMHIFQSFTYFRFLWPVFVLRGSYYCLLYIVCMHVYCVYYWCDLSDGIVSWTETPISLIELKGIYHRRKIVTIRNCIIKFSNDFSTTIGNAYIAITVFLHEQGVGWRQRTEPVNVWS